MQVSWNWMQGKQETQGVQENFPSFVSLVSLASLASLQAPSSSARALSSLDGTSLCLFPSAFGYRWQVLRQPHAATSAPSAGRTVAWCGALSWRGWLPYVQAVGRTT